MVKNIAGEQWKTIEDYPLYSVSNKGRIKRNEYERFYILGGVNEGKGVLRHFNEKLLKRIISSNGYLKVTLYRDRKPHTKAIHRLVAKAFIENPRAFPHVHHIDEDKKNNNVENLAWMTAKENINAGTRTERSRKSLTGRKRRPMSDSQKQKISNTLREKNVNCKIVICDSKTFKSATEAAAFYGEVGSSFRAWLNGRAPMPDHYQQLGLKYLVNEKIRKEI